MPTNIITGATPNFPGTQQAVIAKGFKKRFRDSSIISWITNNDHKGEFKHAGTEIQIPILPVIQTYKVKPGDKVRYQKPKSTFERYFINRERAWGIHIEDEDKLFARFDIESPILAEAAKRMAEDIEAEFFYDNIVNLKCHAKNTGANAGFYSGKYNFGSAATPVALYKNDTKLGSSTGMTGTDYFVDLVDGMSEMPGANDSQFIIVCHSAVANMLHKGDLSHADWMGDAKSVLRGSVKALGEIAGARVITDNKMPIFTNSGANVYPVMIVNKQSISFVEEVTLRNTNMEDIDYWGTFNRTKMIYDWFSIYPEFTGIGFVTLT